MACLKGHTEVAKLLIEAGANKNMKDFDESTPLHCASESGHIDTIEYLVKDAKVDQTIRNKFGYVASDIAQNLQSREALTNTQIEAQSSGMGSDMSTAQSMSSSMINPYGRQAFGGVLMHNDRINSVRKLMAQYKQVNRHLGQVNHNEKQLIQGIENQQQALITKDPVQQKEEEDAAAEAAKKDKNSNKMWK